MKDNTKINLRKVGCEDVDCIHVALSPVVDSCEKSNEHCSEKARNFLIP